MSDIGGKSYNETAAFGADVDLSGEREIEAVRAARRDGTLEQAESFGRPDASSAVAAGVATVRDGIGRAGESIVETATDLYGEAGTLARRRAAEVTSEARTMVSHWVEDKPVHLVLGAMLVGFLFGKFG